MTTNGTLICESVITFLKRNKLDLKISIDGENRFQNQNRPFKDKNLSSYQQVIKNIRFLNSENIPYKVNLTFTRNNYRYLLDNINHLAQLGASYINFYPNLFDLWSQQELKELNIIFDKFTGLYISMFTKNKKRIFMNSLIYDLVTRKRFYNSIFCKKIHLGYNGDIYFCDKVFSLPSDMRKEYKIGSATYGINNKLRLALLKEKRKEIKEFTNGKCDTCHFLQYCFCPIGSYISLSLRGSKFKDYFMSFCGISKIYFRAFLKIVYYLNDNPLFRNFYH